MAIARLLDEKRVDHKLYIKDVIETLEKSLIDADIKGEVYGHKHIYSIWKKCVEKILIFRFTAFVRFAFWYPPSL